MRAILFFAASLACMAQYVATDDGKRLFFTTADRLAGTDQSFRAKLFSWDAEHGIRLVYEAPAEYACCVTITGDGALAAFSLDAGNYPPQTKGVLLDLNTGRSETVGQSAVISRNGRFLFTGDRLLDRITGASRLLTTRPAFVGSDGSLLYKDLYNLHRIDPDGTDRVVMGGMRFGGIADADENTARAIVFPGPSSWVVVDTITGGQVALSATGANARISGDGQWTVSEARVAAYPGTRLQLCRADGSDCRTLGENTSPVAMSRDAGIVFASRDGRVMRIDVSSGKAEPAFATSFFTLLTDAPVVPGSLVRFYGANIGDRITVNGREMPILSQPGGLPMIQIPWELPDQWVKFTMSGGESPFETFTRAYPVSDFYPVGFPPGSPGLNEGQPAYRQDWSATTYDSPASPGEIVHIYATGLGAVDCPVETGVPAPLDRLCRITRPADWQWITAPDITVRADVRFAGLAPGTAGLYQIDVRVPPYTGHEFIALSDGARNARVAFVRIHPQ